MEEDSIFCHFKSQTQQVCEIDKDCNGSGVIEIEFLNISHFQWAI